MDKKLTLSMDGKIIERAKQFAKLNKTSLSKMIESYLDLLTSSSNSEDITPLVKSLSGIIKLPNDYDYKLEKSRYLSQKHK